LEGRGDERRVVGREEHVETGAEVWRASGHELGDDLAAAIDVGLGDRFAQLADQRRLLAVALLLEPALLDLRVDSLLLEVARFEAS
jgi:hypothetical protein